MQNQIEFYNFETFRENWTDKTHQILDFFVLKFKIKIPIKIELHLLEKKDMQTLNYQTRKKNNYTDVISVRGMEQELANKINWWFLGSIYLCLDVIKEQAKNFQHSLEREFLYLFGHGLLHLFGYDHLSEEENKKMHLLVENAMIKFRVLRHE